MTAPGPTGMPAARSARAKPTTLSAMWPVGGLRWSMVVMVNPVSTLSSFRGAPLGASPESIEPQALRNDGLVLDRRFLQNLLQRVALHPRDVVLVFQQRTQGVADHLGRQRTGVEFGQRGGPVDGFGYPRRFVEILVA